MIRVGILRGGTGARYDDSLASGAYVLQNLPRDRYEALDIYIDGAGTWHLGGIPVSHERLQRRVDVIWNALHGFYGEDGKVQQLLENLGIPYTGAGPLSSAVAMNGKLSGDHLARLGVKIPNGLYVEDWGAGGEEETVARVAAEILQKLSPPWNIRPISRSEAGLPGRAKTRGELAAALSGMFRLGIPAQIEETALGRELSVFSAVGFRGKKTYTFLPAEKEGIAARMPKGAGERLQTLARTVHEGLHLGQYSAVRIALDAKGRACVLGFDTMLPLQENSHFHRALAEVGSSFDEFAEWAIVDAMKKNKA